jgi:hypothetical protein
MLKKKKVNRCERDISESAEELVGILTAISIVSKRLAQNLARLEIERGGVGNGRTS